MKTILIFDRLLLDSKLLTMVEWFSICRKTSNKVSQPITDAHETKGQSEVIASTCCWLKGTSKYFSKL